MFQMASNQRRPFRIQNYPDIVSISGRASVVYVAQQGMAVGETGSGQAGARTHIGQRAKKSTGHDGRRSHTLPLHSYDRNAVGGASTSAGLPDGNGAASASARSEPVTRHWASSGSVNSSQPQQAKRVRRQAPQNPHGDASNTSPIAGASSAARPEGTRVHDGRLQMEPALQTRPRAAAAAATSVASPSGPLSSSSSSSPEATAAAAQRSVVGGITSSPSHMADHSNESGINHHAMDHDSIPGSYILPPYESRGATLNWSEIHEPSEALPDLLNSHRVAPYVPTPRQNQHRHAATDRRHRGRRHRHSHPSPVTDLDLEDKDCCSKDCCVDCLTVVTTFRWVLIGLALLGVCCVVAGIVLGALHMTVGSSYLTLSLMFIGLGVMLVVVVGVGWRCTPQGHEPCHLLFGLGEHASFDSRRSRISRPHRDRNQWYGGMMYPEFRYRRPPPSYNAAMQDYQQQLAMAQIRNPEGPNGDSYSLPRSPPPTYRSRASTVRPGIHITFPPQRPDFPASGPPTYRSHADPAERSRPSLIMERDSDSHSAVGLDNPGCTENEGESGGASSLPVGADALSTMARVNRVVEYLDGVLQQQQVSRRASASASGQSTPAREESPASTAVNDAISGDAVANADLDQVADTPL